MSAETWLIIGIVGFSLAGAAFLVAVILFFKLKIPAVIGDLSGRTVAREVKAIRESNRSGGARHSASPAVLDARKRTPSGNIAQEVPSPHLDREAVAMAHASKRLDKSTEEIQEEKRRRNSYQDRNDIYDASYRGNTADQSLDANQATEYLNSNDQTTPLEAPQPGEDTQLLHQGDSTEVLKQNDATEVLRRGDSTEVLKQNNATEVLRRGDSTEVLKQNDATEVLRRGDSTEVLKQNDATEVLRRGDSTEVLKQNDATEVLRRGDSTEVLKQNDATEVLSYERAPMPGTTVLSQQEAPPVSASPVPFRIVRSLERIHTDEVI